MNKGSILIAPAGFRSLVSGTDYYLLGNCKFTQRVTLTFFTQVPGRGGAADRWQAGVITLDRDSFEASLASGLIEHKPSHAALPPWATAYEGVDPNQLESERKSSKRSYQSRVEARFNVIAPLVEREQELLASPNIIKEINAYARSLAPKQNPERVVLWYCTYQVFGQNIWSLMPAFASIGSWSRDQTADTAKKLGRPNLQHGRHSGHSAIPLRERIVQTYLARATLGRSMSSIYSDSMVYDFGCRTTRDSHGNLIIYHPDSKPFPTLNQYRYHAIKSLGLEGVQERKYGQARYRSRLAPSQGKFSEATANLLEAAEADCFNVRELPRQLLTGKPGLPLTVCRFVDVASGSIFGVGLSYGGERAEAYRLAKFFSVAPKTLVGRLFGIEISEDAFPVSGLPPRPITDRGPGSSMSVDEKAEDKPPVRELAPSWSGQSKATVESSHPRDVSLEGAPSYVLSDLNVYEMAKREILRAASDNRTSDASRRLTPEMIAAGTPANPNGIACYLRDRGRVDAIPMSLERAIRAYLSPITFQLDSSGLHLRHLRFDSEAYRATGLDRRPGKNQRISVEGFAMPLTLRYAWIDYKGRLIEVGAMLPLRDDPTQLYVSIYEVDENARMLRELKSEQAWNAAAAAIEARVAFTEATGKEWEGGQRIGRAAPPKAGVSRDDVPDLTASRGKR